MLISQTLSPEFVAAPELSHLEIGPDLSFLLSIWGHLLKSSHQGKRKKKSCSNIKKDGQ